MCDISGILVWHIWMCACNNRGYTLPFTRSWSQPRMIFWWVSMDAWLRSSRIEVKNGAEFSDMKWKVTMTELLTCIQSTSCFGLCLKMLIRNGVWFDFENIGAKETIRLRVTLQWWCVQWDWRKFCSRNKSIVFSGLAPCRDMRADRLNKDIYIHIYIPERPFVY